MSSILIFQQKVGGSRAAVTSKMEHFVIIFKRSILDVAAALDPSLNILVMASVSIALQNVGLTAYSYGTPY